MFPINALLQFYQGHKHYLVKMYILDLIVPPVARIVYCRQIVLAWDKERSNDKKFSNINLTSNKIEIKLLPTFSPKIFVEN